MGQIHPQKKRPKTAVTASINTAVKTLPAAFRTLMDVKKKRLGFVSKNRRSDLWQAQTNRIKNSHWEACLRRTSFLERFVTAFSAVMILFDSLRRLAVGGQLSALSRKQKLNTGN